MWFASVIWNWVVVFSLFALAWNWPIVLGVGFDCFTLQTMAWVLPFQSCAKLTPEGLEGAERPICFFFMICYHPKSDQLLSSFAFWKRRNRRNWRFKVWCWSWILIRFYLRCGVMFTTLTCFLSLWTGNYERLSRLHWPPEPTRQRERCGEVLQGIWAHPWNQPEEWIWLCGECDRLIGGVGQIPARFIERLNPVLCPQEFDDHRDADDAVYELNGKELCSER